MDSELRAVLELYPAIAGLSDAPEPLGNAGGLSGSRLWRYRAGLGLLVARAWPPDGPPRTALEEIHRWQLEARPLGFVPVPVRALDGRTLIERSGRLWEVGPWMFGSPEPRHPPPASRVRSAFAALAAFHQRLAHHRASGPSPGLQARARELDSLIGGGFAEIEKALDLHATDPCADPARRWLDSARPLAPGALDRLKRAAGMLVSQQPCLRDVRPEHFLFSGDSVTGLVDFGAMGIDTVAADLSRLVSEWLGRGPALRTAALDAYAQVRPLAPVETSLIAAFVQSAALLGAGRWVRWHFLEGRPFDDPSAVARGLEKGLERLASLASDS